MTSQYTPRLIHVATRGQDVYLCSSEEAGFQFRLIPIGRADGKEPNAKRQEKGIYNGEFAREVCRRYNDNERLRSELETTNGVMQAGLLAVGEVKWENDRLRELVRDAVFILAGRQRTPCEDGWLKEARAATAERIAK